MALVLFDFEKLELGGDASGADAEVEAAFGEVVEHGKAVGQHLGVVELEEDDAGAQLDVLGFGEGLGDEEVGGGQVLPRDGEMLADPALMVAELVGGDDGLHVLFDCALQALGGMVDGHHEKAEVHKVLLWAGCDARGRLG